MNHHVKSGPVKYRLVTDNVLFIFYKLGIIFFSTILHFTGKKNQIQSCFTCLTLWILAISSSAETLPAITSRGIPLSPIKKLDGIHTTGSLQ